MSSHETDGDLLASMSTDAAVWAQEMAKIAQQRLNRLSVVLDPEPGGWLHGWLCNAIEAGRSAGYAEAQRELAETLPFTVKMYAAEEFKSIVGES